MTTWKIAERFSLKEMNDSVSSCSRIAIVTPATNAATNPLPIVASERPKARRPSPSA